MLILPFPSPGFRGELVIGLGSNCLIGTVSATYVSVLEKETVPHATASGSRVSMKRRALRPRVEKLVAPAKAKRRSPDGRRRRTQGSPRLLSNPPALGLRGGWQRGLGEAGAHVRLLPGGAAFALPTK